MAFDQVFEADLAAGFGQNRNAVRIPFAEDGARLDFLVLVDLEDGAGRHFVLLHFAAFVVDERDFAVAGEHDLLAFVVRHDLEPRVLDDAAALGLDIAFFDVVLTDAADVERTHRELRARLADALGGDDADGHALFDQRAGRKVHAVAAAADAQRRIAGHGAANLNLFQAQLFDLAGDLGGDQFVFADDHFIGDRVDDVGAAHAAADRVGQADFDLFAAVDDALRDALRRAAIFHRDHDVLRHVGQLAGQVTRVGRLEGRIGQALAGTVRRAEVLEHRQAFAEVGLDRRFDDLAGRLGHQTAHAAELAHLFDTTASTGVGHQEDRVHVAAGAVVVFQRGHHFGRDLFAGVRPGVEHLVVALALGDDAALIELVLLEHFLFGGAR